MRVAALACHPVKSLGGLMLEEAELTPLGLAGDRRWVAIGPDGVAITQREFARMAAIGARPLPSGGLALAVDGRSLEIAPPGGEHGRTMAVIWGTGVDAALAAPEAGAFLSEALGTESRLVWLDRDDARPCGVSPSGAAEYTSFADSLPLLVTTTGSLAALNASLIGQGLDGVPMDRFRANIVIEHDAPWVEHGWPGLRIGAAELRFERPCERCVVPTIDQQTGAVDPRSAQARGLLRTLVGAAGIGRRAVFGVNAVPVAATCPAWLRVGDRVTVTG